MPVKRFFIGESGVGEPEGSFPAVKSRSDSASSRSPAKAGRFNKRCV